MASENVYRRNSGYYIWNQIEEEEEGPFHTQEEAEEAVGYEREFD